jgi:SAM-dependent methyltransferase
MPNIIRPCPICSNTTSKPAPPWAIKFEDKIFEYFQCISCRTVFVNPVPDTDSFARMYAKTNYHDFHYSDYESTRNDASVKMLNSLLLTKSLILDYGCGVGHFLRSVQSAGYQAIGVEFDSEAAIVASHNSGCKVFSVAEFFHHYREEKFDLIHLGDVLEHLPEPKKTLEELLIRLKSGGLLFIEGPLEVNPSPVYWAMILFSNVKRRLNPRSTGEGQPTHLLRTDAKQQLDFFYRVNPNLKLLYWEVYETGWPYTNNGRIKNFIASTAKIIGGKKIFGITFGNRFIGIFKHNAHRHELL